jgi:glutathione reductase (NADPH)
VLLGAAEVVERVRAMRGKGVAGDVRVDWAELMQFKRSFTESVPVATEKRFKDAGIGMFHGTARFTGPQMLLVGADELEANQVVIAAGARPATLGIEGEELLTLSDAFLDLDKLPERIVFVGGGYVSFEFAHLAARTGARVTVLHEGARALERFDADLVERLVAWSREIGIEVHLGVAVRGVERDSQGLQVTAERDGQRVEFAAAMVVHGAGRVPNLEGLELATAGVASGRHGVLVNEYLQSRTNEAVYAAGDCAASGNAPLTPVAGWEARVVVENLLKGNQRKALSGSIPSVVFTLPPLAAVGVDETTAREQGLDFRVATGDMAGWYSSRRIGERCAAYKVLVENGTERILGAHLLGAQAEEHINLFALAMRHGLTAAEIAETLYAYPTHGSNTQYMIP